MICFPIQYANEKLQGELQVNSLNWLYFVILR